MVLILIIRVDVLASHPCVSHQEDANNQKQHTDDQQENIEGDAIVTLLFDGLFEEFGSKDILFG